MGLGRGMQETLTPWIIKFDIFLLNYFAKTRSLSFDWVK